MASIRELIEQEMRQERGGEAQEHRDENREFHELEKIEKDLRELIDLEKAERITKPASIKIVFGPATNK